MDKDAIIEKLTKQIASLLGRIKQLEQENATLKERIAQLQKNSSKPPSSDIVKPTKLSRMGFSPYGPTATDGSVQQSA